MGAEKLLVIVVSAIFINNIILSRFLGICPYIGVSKKLGSAIGMGFAVIFVLTIASSVTYLIYVLFLYPSTNNFWYWITGKMYDLTYLRTITFILVIASLVQLVEMVVQKISPPLYKALGIYLPLITTNCAVLGISVLNIEENYNFIESTIHGFAVGIGFTLVLILMAGLREKLDLMDLPKPFEGPAIAFILAGLMSIAFLGFAGLKF